MREILILRIRLGIRGNYRWCILVTRAACFRSELLLSQTHRVRHRLRKLRTTLTPISSFRMKLVLACTPIQKTPQLRSCIGTLRSPDKHTPHSLHLHPDPRASAEWASRSLLPPPEHNKPGLCCGIKLGTSRCLWPINLPSDLGFPS